MKLFRSIKVSEKISADTQRYTETLSHSKFLLLFCGLQCADNALIGPITGHIGFFISDSLIGLKIIFVHHSIGLAQNRLEILNNHKNQIFHKPSHPFTLSKVRSLGLKI